MNRLQRERLMEKLEFEMRSEQYAEQAREEENTKIKRSEYPYIGINCAWCLEDCEED